MLFRSRDQRPGAGAPQLREQRIIASSGTCEPMLSTKTHVKTHLAQTHTHRPEKRPYTTHHAPPRLLLPPRSRPPLQETSGPDLHIRATAPRALTCRTAETGPESREFLVGFAARPRIPLRLAAPPFHCSPLSLFYGGFKKTSQFARKWGSICVCALSSWCGYRGR